MSFKRCPGSLTFAQPQPENVSCPDCESEVEIWSDEATGRCPQCGKIVIRTDTQSCVDWCRYALDCLGEEKYEQYGRMKATMRKAALQQALQQLCGPQSAEVRFSETAVRYAEIICAEEECDDHNLVLAAAILAGLFVNNDIETGCARSHTILQELDYDPAFSERLQHLLAVLFSQTSADLAKDGDYAIVHDAVLVARDEQRLEAGEDVLENNCSSACLTDRGRKTAVEIVRLQRRTK